MEFVDEYLKWNYYEQYLSYPLDYRIELYRLLHLDLKKLKFFAKTRGLKRYSTLRKRDLVHKLFTHYVITKNGIKMKPVKTIVPAKKEQRINLEDLEVKHDINSRENKPKLVIKFED